MAGTFLKPGFTRRRGRDRPGAHGTDRALGNENQHNRNKNADGTQVLNGALFIIIYLCSHALASWTLPHNRTLAHTGVSLLLLVVGWHVPLNTARPRPPEPNRLFKHAYPLVTSTVLLICIAASLIVLPATTHNASRTPYTDGTLAETTHNVSRQRHTEKGDPDEHAPQTELHAPQAHKLIPRKQRRRRLRGRRRARGRRTARTPRPQADTSSEATPDAATPNEATPMNTPSERAPPPTNILLAGDVHPNPGPPCHHPRCNRSGEALLTDGWCQEHHSQCLSSDRPCGGTASTGRACGLRAFDMHVVGCPALRGAVPCVDDRCKTFSCCSYHLDSEEKEALAKVLAVRPAANPVPAALPGAQHHVSQKVRRVNALRQVPTPCLESLHQALIALLRPFRDADAAGKDEIIRKLIDFPATRLHRPMGDQLERIRQIRKALAATELPAEPNAVVHPSGYTDTPEAHNAARYVNDPVERLVRRARSSVREGFIGRGARTLWRSITAAAASLATLIPLLQALHPPEPPCGAIPTPGPVVIAITPEELAKWAKRHARGGASDIFGWSDGLLAQCLENTEVASCFVDVYLHIANNQVGELVRDSLASCILIGIPKFTDEEVTGVRPIAIGTIILKFVAGLVASKLIETIAAILRPLQLGVGTPGGAETVAHRVRADVRSARETGEDLVVCTVDFKNAYNSLRRWAMRSELTNQAGLSSLFALFNLAYAQKSALHTFGANGESETLFSECGCRQGDPLGALLFCISLHPILLKASAAFPTVKIYAYMDDITITGPSAAVAACFAMITAEARKIGLEKHTGTWVNGVYKPGKCQWFARTRTHMPNDVEFIDATDLATGAIKILGVWIGNDEAVKSMLDIELEEGRQHVARLRKLDGHEALLILLKSLTPRWGFILRTHPPEITTSFAAKADEVLLEALSFLADTNISVNSNKRANMLRSLPTRLGGLGLLSPIIIRTAAYDSSLEAAQVDLSLPHADYVTARRNIESQAARSEKLHQAILAQLGDDPELCLLLEDAATPSSSAWLRDLPMCTKPYNHEEVGAALRLRLGLTHPMVDQKCPGCGIKPSDTRFTAHISGCTRIKGHNSATAHAEMKRGIRNIARYCGVTVDPKEPSQYDLPRGRAEDGSQNLSRPDIRFHPAEGTPIVIDHSITSGVLAPHHSKGLHAILTRERLKETMYKQLVEANGERFLPVVVTALGSITNTSSLLWSALAKEYGRMSVDQVKNEIVFSASRARAISTLHAEKLLGAPHRIISFARSAKLALPHYNTLLDAAFASKIDPEARNFVLETFVNPSLTISQRTLAFISRHAPVPLPALPRVLSLTHKTADLSDEPRLYTNLMTIALRHLAESTVPRIASNWFMGRVAWLWKRVGGSELIMNTLLAVGRAAAALVYRLWIHVGGSPRFPQFLVCSGVFCLIAISASYLTIFQWYALLTSLYNAAHYICNAAYSCATQLGWPIILKVFEWSCRPEVFSPMLVSIVSLYLHRQGKLADLLLTILTITFITVGIWFICGAFFNHMYVLLEQTSLLIFPQSNEPSYWSWFIGLFAQNVTEAQLVQPKTPLVFPSLSPRATLLKLPATVETTYRNTSHLQQSRETTAALWALPLKTMQVAVGSWILSSCDLFLTSMTSAPFATAQLYAADSVFLH